MTREKFTVGELINELEKLPKDLGVELSVHYDNCHHIQPLGSIYSIKGIDWIILKGEKE